MGNIMKYAITLLSFLFLSSVLSAAEQSIKLSIPGMNCSICPITVKKSLQKVEGVKSVNVIYESKTVEIWYDDQLTNISSLQKATKNVGYPSLVAKKDKEK